MRLLPTILVTALLGLLTSCGSAEKSEPAPPPAPPKETVFDPLLQQRDRAQQAADTLPKERKENLDKAIEGDAQ